MLFLASSQVVVTWTDFQEFDSIRVAASVDPSEFQMAGLENLDKMMVNSFLRPTKAAMQTVFGVFLARQEQSWALQKLNWTGQVHNPVNQTYANTQPTLYLLPPCWKKPCCQTLPKHAATASAALKARMGYGHESTFNSNNGRVMIYQITAKGLSSNRKGIWPSHSLRTSCEQVWLSFGSFAHCDSDLWDMLITLPHPIFAPHPFAFC